MAFEHLFLAAAKVVVLLLGMTIAALAFLAYRRSGERLMLGLSVGFALMAIGSFLEGVLFEILSWDLMTVRFIESVFVFAGLGTIAFLLRPRKVKG
ncbi:MAG TPA: hypothetical protein VI999_00615 [Thermoplasmata archaeon]|nr:hypothetical protein [Thermoplasmata archaeon]